ncbi:hypothetical protein LXL04_027400 [Taraxacum kok-saghyz]
MTGKAKPKKHTAKEIAAKVDATMTNRGGGKAGVADRTGKLSTLRFPMMNLKSLIHAVLAPVADTSKPRPGVRGSLKK